MKKLAFAVLLLSTLLVLMPQGFESNAQPGSLQCINFPSCSLTG